MNSTTLKSTLVSLMLVSGTAWGYCSEPWDADDTYAQQAYERCLEREAEDERQQLQQDHEWSPPDTGWGREDREEDYHAAPDPGLRFNHGGPECVGLIVDASKCH